MQDWTGTKKIGPGIFWSRRPTTAYDIAYTTIQKFLNSKIFFFFFNEVSSAHQPCIYLIQNTAKAVILWNIFAI